MKPLCIDLFCGLGGWTDGFLAEGYDVVGFDIERRPYPAQLVIQDVLTIHGSQFRSATCIVASPPCQTYSYLAMPWSRSPDIVRPCGDGWEILNSRTAKEMLEKWKREGPDNRLFDACFRIQREASESAGHYIPLMVENVRGAQPWVGRAAWIYGSFYLWGDVPALMPTHRTHKNRGGSWFAIAHNTGSGHSKNPVHELTGVECRKRFDEHGNEVGSWFRRTQSGNTLQDDFRLNPDDAQPNGTKIGGDWFRDPSCHSRHSSRSDARRAASAQVAKIPLPLAQHIAAVYKQRSLEKVA